MTKDLYIDGFFWSRHFEHAFCRPVEVFVEAVEKRLLPTFDNLEKEAEAVAQAEWKSFMSTACCPDDCVDPGDFAEQAQDAGIDYYQSLSNVRQSLLNLSVVALHHMFEQQMLWFFQREVIHPGEEQCLRELIEENPRGAQKLLNLKVVEDYLKSGGIDLGTLNCWSTLHELRLVANTVKHASGAASEELRKRRTNLFVHPALRDERPFSSSRPRLYRPAAGEDLYLMLEDLKAYGDAVQQFWREFGEIVLERSRRQRNG